MNRNFLHFISETPCMLNINGEYVGIIDNKFSFELDIITNTSQIFATNTPISNTINTLPNTFNINTAKEPCCDSDYIDIVPFPNNHYDIILKPFYYYQINQSTILFNENVGKYFISVISDQQSRISIFSGDNIVFNINTPKLISVKAEIKNDLIIIKGIIDNNTYYLLVIDSKNFSVIHNDISHSIENTDNYIQSFKRLKTILKQASVTKIYIENKNIENYYVYEEENPHIHSELFIPEAFLESIKIGDEKTAHSLLSSSLSNTNLNQLKNYFGDIKKTYLNRHYIGSKCNYTIFNNTYKNYTFEINNYKISDIEEIF